MTVRRINTTVDLISPTGSTVVSLRPTDASWTWDEGTSPILTGTVTVAMPTDAQYAMLRPGAGYFLSVQANQVPFTVNGGAGVLLRITDRTRTAFGLVELQIASAEVDLQAYTPSAVDRSNWANQGSIGAIVYNVLNKVWGTQKWMLGRLYGGFGGVDDPFNLPGYPTYAAATNLIPNGSFEYGLDGWTGSFATLSRITGWRANGLYSLNVKAASSSSNDTYAWTPLALNPSTTYTLTGTIRTGGGTQSGANGYARRLVVVARIGGVSRVIAATDQAPNAANGTTRVSATFTTPAVIDDGGVTLRAYCGVTTASNPDVYWDGIMLLEGNGYETDNASSVAYFDGDTADGTGGYNYDWQGDPGASASTRTPVLARDPETLTWTPGQSAWDFLQPILQSVDVRLASFGWNADFGAMKPSVTFTYNEWGVNFPQRVMQGVNLMDVSQIDSFSAEFSDGTPMYADQVIIHYVWTDALGVTRDAYDVYPATGKKPYFLELTDTPFAGKGRAQGIWKRISARGTIVQGTADFLFVMLAGIQVAITADAVGGSVVGYVEAVTQNPMRGTTEFRTKKTIAFTAASWSAAAGSWASQTGSWAADS